MFKLFMNEPFSSGHELVQARRLVEVLSRVYAGNDAHAWLCLNFSLGGKSLDGAFITPDRFVILEFKAVGGDVDCEGSMENSQWRWRTDSFDSGQIIRTTPYANPFSQLKNYRIAAVGELEHRQRGFLGRKTRLKAEVDFARWVKCCVLLSRRNADDVRVSLGELSCGTQKWFCYGTMGNVVDRMAELVSTVRIAPKEIERLIADVLGLRCVGGVLESLQETEVVDVGDSIAAVGKSISAVESFRKRYGYEAKARVRKATVKKEFGKGKVVKSISEIDKLLHVPKECESNQGECSRGSVRVAMQPIQCDYLKNAILEEMKAVAPGCGELKEIDGEDAVLEVRRSCPEIRDFDVSKVLRFGDMIPERDKDEVLSHIREKIRNPRLHQIVYSHGGVNFIFGTKISNLSVAPKTTLKRDVNTTFFPARWVWDFVEKESEGLPKLSVEEVQVTTNLTAEDVRRYACTYLPRSCAEAFVVVDWLLGDEMIPMHISILDLGCGCGGASLGCLLALRKHSVLESQEFLLTGVDANENSIAFLRRLFNKARPFLDGKLDLDLQTGDMLAGSGSTRKYDMVIASKSIGEIALVNGGASYCQAVDRIAEYVDDHGSIVLIDIPKHKESLEVSVCRMRSKGFEGDVRTLSISLPWKHDKETYVCACLRRTTSEVMKG